MSAFMRTRISRLLPTRHTTTHAGYLLDPLGTGRLAGLFAGGFWGNMGAVLFCCLTNAGLLAPEPANFTIVYCAVCGVVIFILCVVKMITDSKKNKDN